MSYFGSNYSIQKSVVVKFFGSRYETASGLTGMLAETAALTILEKFVRTNTLKYGSCAYSDPEKLKLWRTHKSRLRKRFYRRALPIIEKLFKQHKESRS